MTLLRAGRRAPGEGHHVGGSGGVRHAVAEPLAGPGRGAAMVAGVRLDLLDSPATAILTGGELKLEWHGGSNPVMMTGETAMVYQGEIEYE